MTTFGWLIIGLLVLFLLFSFHPYGRRFYGYHYGRARRYWYGRYRRYRGWY